VTEYSNIQELPFLTNGVYLTNEGMGTIIGRKSVSKGKEYCRIWVYIPTKVSEDTSFPFNAGEPCIVKIENEQLIVKQVSQKDAIKHGWKKRARKKAKTD
jgi:hypothetical protein